MMLLALLAALHGSLQFVDDDYPKALAQAKAAHKPLFVDFWATWCHSCLSMQRYVLADPGMKPVADEVVWAAIETETEKNKPIVEKFPLDNWPTFLIVDPATEQVLGRFLGSGTVQEIRAFVQDGVRAYRNQGKPADAASAAQREGDRARIAGDVKGAAEAYGRAVQLSRPRDPDRPERLTLYARTLLKLKDAAACDKLGLAEARGAIDTAVGADFLSYIHDCASDAKVKQAALERLRAIAFEKGAPLAADDRSDAMANLADMLDAAGKHDQAVQVMRERAAVLEEAAARAPDVTMASTFDAHRTDTYLYLGEPQKAEKLLAEREKQMPDDYNPPARLARVLLEEKRLPEAEKAVDRALDKMPRSQRRVSILALKARILAAQGKSEEPALKEELEVLRSLPASQRKPEQEEKLSEQLGAPRK